MKNKTKMRLKAVSIICALVVVFISALPLFNRETDARLLGVLTGSFGAGMLFASLIQEIRKHGEDNRRC